MIDGLSVSSSSAVSGETLTITLTSQETPNGTVIPYTISGVESSDINNAPLTGNFTIVNGLAAVSFLITTTSKKTLSIVSNGFTQSVQLAENIYGLRKLTEDSNQIFTSVNNQQIVNLSTSTSLLTITILQTTNLYNNIIQTGETITFGEKTSYSTDFASITNFNVPEPDPLVFQERWAG
jgi:hypothetical protein